MYQHCILSVKWDQGKCLKANTTILRIQFLVQLCSPLEQDDASFAQELGDFWICQSILNEL